MSFVVGFLLITFIGFQISDGSFLQDGIAILAGIILPVFGYVVSQILSRFDFTKSRGLDHQSIGYYSSRTNSSMTKKDNSGNSIAKGLNRSCNGRCWSCGHSRSGSSDCASPSKLSEWYKNNDIKGRGSGVKYAGDTRDNSGSPFP